MTDQLQTLAAFFLPSTLALVAAPIFSLPRRPRGLVVALVVLAMTPIPLLVPRTDGVLRAVDAIIVLFMAAKLVDLHVQRGPRPSAREYVAFIYNPYTAVLRRLSGEPRYSTSQNLRRLARGSLFAVAGGAALVYIFVTPVDLGPRFVEHTVKLFAFYLALEGFLVANVSVVRLLGVPARDILEQPYLAVTPGDFWQRYNRVIGQFLFEDVFRRVGGLRAPVRATMITFVISAIAHEYLFSITLEEVQGYQTAFFLIQGLAVALTLRVRPEGPWRFVGLAATLTFNVATSFLFYQSVQPLYPWWTP